MTREKLFRAAVAASCAVALFAARGEAYEKYYLKYAVDANYQATVTNNAVWYKLYDKAGEKWAVLTGHDASLARIEPPAAVSWQENDYPVRALGNQSLGGWYWGQNNALKTFDLSRITIEDTNWVVPNPAGMEGPLEKLLEEAVSRGRHRFSWDGDDRHSC